MKQLIVLVGCPGSGKSVHAKTLPGTYINQDSQGRDHFRLFMEAISRGDENIVLDRMNFDHVQRDRYTIPARAVGYSVIIRVFVVPRKVCYDRVVARIGNHETINSTASASSAINLFFAKYEKPQGHEADAIEFVEYGGGVGEDKPKAIICDLDGTLCTITHRLHFVTRGKGVKKDWQSFFKGLGNDTVNEPVAEVVRRFSGDHEILYCSGRGEESREATEAWLKANNLWFGHLFMRSANDFRPDDLVKEILLDHDILPQFDPVIVFDDRNSVVKMWRSRGFTVAQVADGDF